MAGTRSLALLCATLLAAGCSQPDDGSPTVSTTAGPSTSLPDARLGPVIQELDGHPEWTEGGSEFEVMSALPSLRELCVAVTPGDGSELHVMVDVDANPWKVQAVAIFDEVDGPHITHESEGVAGNGHLCTFVLLGTPDPFPSDPADIEVNGGVAAEQAAAIRQALHTTPGRFGIDREGAPAINLHPVTGSDDETDCFYGVVYVGGPRAKVLIGLRQESAGWGVTSIQIVEQALHAAEARPPDGC